MPLDTNPFYPPDNCLLCTIQAGSGLSGVLKTLSLDLQTSTGPGLVRAALTAQEVLRLMWGTLAGGHKEQLTLGGRPPS